MSGDFDVYPAAWGQSLPPHTEFPLPQALHPRGKGAAVKHWRGQELGAHLSSAQSSRQKRLLQAAWQRNGYLPTQRASVERANFTQGKLQRGNGWSLEQRLSLSSMEAGVWGTTGTVGPGLGNTLPKSLLCVLVLLLHRSASPISHALCRCSIGQIKALRTAQTAEKTPSYRQTEVTCLLNDTRLSRNSKHGARWQHMAGKKTKPVHPLTPADPNLWEKHSPELQAGQVQVGRSQQVLL